MSVLSVRWVGRWCAVAAVVLTGATAAVPLVVPDVGGTPVAAPALLTVDYDEQPHPGLLLDLTTLLNWQQSGEKAEAAERVGPVGWVWTLSEDPGLLVVPHRSGRIGLRTDVAAVMVEPDGTERWRVTDDRFADVTTQECSPAPQIVTCWGVDGDRNSVVLQIRVGDGAVVAEHTLPDATVKGVFHGGTDLLVLGRGTDLVRYRPTTGKELWSVEVSAWVTNPDELWGYQFENSRFVLNTSDGGALLDPADGELLWRTTGHLTIVNDQLFEIDWVAQRTRRLDELGLPVWTAEGADHRSWFHGDPLVAQDGMVRRLDAVTGDVRWSTSHEWSDGWVNSGPDLVWMTSSSGGRSRLLDPESGKTGAEFEGSVVAAERGLLYLQDTMSAADPTLRAVTADGEQLWELELAELVPGLFPNTLVLAGRLVVQTDSHLLFLEP